jgi:hypothetical protein
MKQKTPPKVKANCVGIIRAEFTPCKSTVICTYNSQKCLKRFIKTRIGQKYCLQCTGVLNSIFGHPPLEHIKGTSKYIYKMKGVGLAD